MAKLLIKNGRIIDPASNWDKVSDVLVEDGLISGIGENLSVPGAVVVDATGLVVAPGFLDIHVHLREPGFEHAETIETGAKAAAAGGFTSICCMPNTSPVNDNATVTSYIIERAKRRAPVNVYPIGAITKGSMGEELASVGSMAQAGVVAISDDGKPVMNSRIMRRAMETAKSFGIPVINHCEDLNLSAGGDMHEGLVSTRLGLRGIPSCSEDVIVARDLLLAELTSCRYHVAHISTERAVKMVAFAKMKGMAVSCEATPHHFAISDDQIAAYDSNYKMKPPLRCHADVDAVIDGIVDGVVEVIATDHAPHAGSEKMQEFERCPFGITGLETAIGLTLERLVHPGRITLKHMIELFTVHPARVMSLPKGALAVGSPADVTIFSTTHEWTYDVNQTFSKSKNSPFHDHTFKGGPIATMVAGEFVWKAAGFAY